MPSWALIWNRHFYSNSFYFIHTYHHYFYCAFFAHFQWFFFVYLLSFFSFFLHFTGPCPQGTFACDGSTLCVPQRQICDNRTDCEDGSDEHPVECGLLYGSKALTDKIVGNAIERRRQQQQQYPQSKSTHGGRKGTSGELINATLVGVTQEEPFSATDGRGAGSKYANNDRGDEVAYCGKCSFRRRTWRLCGRIIYMYLNYFAAVIKKNKKKKKTIPDLFIHCRNFSISKRYLYLPTAYNFVLWTQGEINANTALKCRGMYIHIIIVTKAKMCVPS